MNARPGSPRPAAGRGQRAMRAGAVLVIAGLFAPGHGGIAGEDVSGRAQMLDRSSLKMAAGKLGPIAPKRALPERSTSCDDGVTARVAGSPRCVRAGDTFADFDGAPEMVVVPGGTFTMGSPGGESGRDADEGPQHQVTIASPFAIGRFEVTRDEFAAFVREAGEVSPGPCAHWTGTEFAPSPDRSWQSPGFEQTGRHPVVCISLADATAYVDWLTARTGARYRLPSEAEWEYAARAGTTTAYPFGDDQAELCGHANGLDEAAKAEIERASKWTVIPCSDAHAFTAPVGTYAGNGFGLHDMHGNVYEWLADCWSGSYEGAPADGSPATSGDCSRHVIRGGSWFNTATGLRSAVRAHNVPEVRFSLNGFRVARTLAP